MSFKTLGHYINKIASRGPYLPGVHSNIDAIVVIDTSTSMDQTDFVPTRIAAAQAAAVRFVRERAAIMEGARIGIVGFGAVAIAACPLTSCGRASDIELAIEELSIVGNTNMTAGLLAAECLFKLSPRWGVTREVRLLTDGIHNVGPTPHQVGDRLKRDGCVIHALGIGGNRAAVDEALLKEICSKDEEGKPHYEFITDQQGLMRYFGEAGGLTR